MQTRKRPARSFILKPLTVLLQGSLALQAQAADTFVDLAGAGNGTYSTPYAVSADGSTMVGDFNNSGGYNEAFRWTSAGMTGLGFIGTGTTSYASAVSADGSTVVGQSNNTLGNSEAFRWTSGTGMQSITTWLANAGVTPTTAFTSSPNSRATGVSANGNVVVGFYAVANAPSHAWLARVDSTGIGLLTNTGVFNSGLIEAGSRGVQAGAALPNLTLFGAHHRSILDNGLVRTGSDGTCAWSTLDAAGYNKTSAQSQLAEVGACKDFGTARFGIGIGQAWTQQNLSLNGNARYNGQYLLLEGAKAFTNGLQPSVIGYFGRFDSNMSRHYMNGAAVDSSNGKTNSNSYAISAKLDWKDAKVIGRFSLSPYAAYTWSQSKLNAYTETGGGFPASFEASTWTTNDIRVGSAAKTALNPTTDLRLGAEIVHRFENNTSGVNGQVIGLWSFSLPGQHITQTWARAIVDVDHRITDKVAFTVGGSAASTGSDASWAVTVGLRANF